VPEGQICKCKIQVRIRRKRALVTVARRFEDFVIKNHFAGVNKSVQITSPLLL